MQGRIARSRAGGKEASVEKKKKKQGSCQGDKERPDVLSLGKALLGIIVMIMIELIWVRYGCNGWILIIYNWVVASWMDRCMQ